MTGIRLLNIGRCIRDLFFGRSASLRPSIYSSILSILSRSSSLLPSPRIVQRDRQASCLKDICIVFAEMHPCRRMSQTIEIGKGDIGDGRLLGRDARGETALIAFQD